MENVNTTPIVKEVETVKVLEYRKNSACWAFHTSVLAMAGEFDLNMVLQVVREFAKTNNVDLGNEVRNARHVLQQMLEYGLLTRVKRGRWTVKK